MRTVLFCEVTHCEVGGVAVSHQRLAEALPGHGWRPVFGLTWGRRFHDALRFRASSPQMETVLLDGRTGTRDGRRLAVARAIRKVRPDVVMPGALTDAWSVLRDLRSRGSATRLFYESVGMFGPTFAAVKRMASSVDFALGVSPLSAHLLRHYCGIPDERVAFVPNGVPRPVHERETGRDGILRLGYVGRLDPDKNALDIARFCREMERFEFAWELTVAGTGSLDAEIRRLAAPAIEAGRLRLLGSVSPAALYETVYPRLDAILLFSPSEGGPNALLEAMMHGVPCVSSDYLGRSLQGVLEHEKTALLFPVGDVAEAARGVARLASDAALRAEIGNAGRLLAEERSGIPQMARRYAAALDRAVEAPPRAPSGFLDEADTARSRLRAVLSPELAEAVRRLLRREFPHPDAGEWPLLDNTPLAPGEPDARALEQEISRAVGSERVESAAR